MSKRASSIGAAAAMQYSSKIICIVMQLVLQAVLARLLAPSEFGIVAVVAVFLAFFNILSDLGISPAIIQFNDLGRKEYGQLFLASSILGIILMAAFAALSLPIAWFYEDELYRSYIPVASVTVLFATLNAVPNGLMLKRRLFAAIAVRQIVASAASVAISIAMAYTGFGCYALIFQSISSAMIVFAWNFLSVRQDVHPHIQGLISTIRRIFKYSSFQSIWAIINYFSRSLDSLLLAKFMGPETLGFYDRAYKLTTYPVTNVSGVLGGVLQPFLSKYQHDYAKMYCRYVEILKPVSLVAVLIAAEFLLCPREIVLLFYGEQWEESVVLFQLLSTSVYFQIMNNLISPLLQSTGRTDVLFISGTICTAMTLTAIIAGVFSGSVVTLAALVASAYTLHTAVYVVIVVRRLFKRSIGRYFKEFLPEAAFLVICVLAVVTAERFVGQAESLLASLVVKTSIILLVYVAVMGMFKQFSSFRNIVKSEE